MNQNATVHLLLRRRADSDTAIAADDIRTKTPVAYAPPWASTFASNIHVTVKQIAVNTSTSGRVARDHSGAIPYRGRYLGTILSRPAIADAPANHRIRIVLRSYSVPNHSLRYLCAM